MTLLDKKYLKEKYKIADFAYTDNPIPISLEHYRVWVEQGGHGPLAYMADHRQEIRSDLKKYFPDFQAALVFLFPYGEEKKKWNDFYQSTESNGLKISGFAMGFSGEDYHQYLKQYLAEISADLVSCDTSLKTAIALDTHPVLERDLAYRSGLGWFGRNSMFISRAEGSYFMIGSLLLSKKLDLPTRDLETDHCGQCTACVDSCPTAAIDYEARTIISDKCISTYTIELFKDNTPAPSGFNQSNGEIFGCDICQEVCPWNKRKMKLFDHLKWIAPQTGPLQAIYTMFLIDPIKSIQEKLQSLSNREFKKIFRGTALARTGRMGLLKNLKHFK